MAIAAVIGTMEFPIITSLRTGKDVRTKRTASHDPRDSQSAIPAARRTFVKSKARTAYASGANVAGMPITTATGE